MMVVYHLVTPTEYRLHSTPPPPPQPPSQHHKLLCFYFTNRGKPRLILRPVKVEVVFPRPRIVVFRDLLSEQEMARLRELAQPLVRKGGWGQWGRSGGRGGVGQVRWMGWGGAAQVGGVG